MRILSQPAYPSPQPPSIVIDRLRAAVAHPSHAFWPDEVSLLDDRAVDARRVLGPRQVTDLYLLALAVRNGGRLATFDAGIPISPIRGATADHRVVV